MSQEFTDAVARCPELWGRKIITILGTRDGMACVRIPSMPEEIMGVSRFWVPIEKLEKIGRRPVRTVATRQPSKRSEVC